MSPALLPFGDLIGAEEFARFVTSSPGKRRRIYPPDVTLRAFLSQVVGRAGSCQEAVTEVCLANALNSKRSPSLNTASYSRARGRLNVAAIKDLAREVHLETNKAADERWCWKGRKVTIIDGSTIAMADTPDNVAVYPKRSNHNEYLGYPLARVMMACSLETGSVADFSISPWRGKSTGEIPLGAKLLDTFERGNIVLADAMFVSYSFIGLCQRRGLDFVGHKKANRKFTILAEQRIGDGDRLIKIKKPRIPHTGWIQEDVYSDLPDTITLRETKINIEKIGFRTRSVTVLSTLTDVEKYSKSDLAQLLIARWNIELDLRIVKTELGLKFLRAKTPDMVIKEIWVNLLAFNLIRRLINAVASVENIEPRRISFKKTLDYYLTSYRLIRFNVHRLAKIAVATISRFFLRKQDGRFEPRARKTTQGRNDYNTLTLPRHQWKLLQILPHLEDKMKFSQPLKEALDAMRQRITNKDGRPMY